MNFHENPSSESRHDKCGKTDRDDEVYRLFSRLNTNAPKNAECIKIVFSIFYTKQLKHTLGLHITCLIITSDFNHIWSFSTDISKILDMKFHENPSGRHADT